MKMNMNYDNASVHLTPAQYLRFMYENTNEDGTLFIPELHREDPIDADEEANDRFDKYTMSWEENDLEGVVSEFNALYADLEKLAKDYDKLSEYEQSDDGAERVKTFLNSQRLFETWYTFIREWELDGLDEETLIACEKRLRSFMYDKDISEKEQKLFEEHCNEYNTLVLADCKKRIGESEFADAVIIRAKRLYKLLSLSAPNVLIENEARLLIERMALHKFAK